MSTSTANSDFWVLGIRQQLKLTKNVGSSYRISQQSGKCKLDIQYSDKSRKVATLPIDWKQENARLIENSVIKIARFVSAGKTLKEAVAITFGGNSEAPEPTEDEAIVDLILSFDIWGKNKVANNEIKQSTWEGTYQKYRKKLEYVLSSNEVTNSKRLLGLLVKVQMPNSRPHLHAGTRTREQVVGAVCTWLEESTELEEFEEGYLNPKFWTPPKKGSKAKKKLVGHHVSKTDAIPIYDDEFIKIPSPEAHDLDLIENTKKAADIHKQVRKELQEFIKPDVKLILSTMIGAFLPGIIAVVIIISISFALS